jgi:(p)ppGpp synthase/HD superfamily hydrolase
MENKHSARARGDRKAISPILTSRFTDAFAFAHVVHAAQERKGTTIPYLSHLMAVASLVLEHGGDEEMAIAGLLHDAAEDQGGYPMLDQIHARFGERVASIVEACTDTFEKPKPPYLERKQAYIDHLKVAHVDACVVAAADKLHNARAIRADFRVEGAALWERFNADSGTLHWYYGGVAKGLEPRLKGHRGHAMVEELQDIVGSVWGVQEPRERSWP